MKSSKAKLKLTMQEHCRENLPNTKFLVFNQVSLRLRHLSQVVAFNLSDSPTPERNESNVLPSYCARPDLKCGFFFTLESLSQSEPEYTSDLKQGSNSAWEPFDCAEVFPVNLLNRKGVLVRVWQKNYDSQEPVLVTSWGVHFSGLIPVSMNSSCSFLFGPNTLLFKLSGRFYTSFDCLRNLADPRDENLFWLYQSLEMPMSDTRPSYSVSSLCKLHMLQLDQAKDERKRVQLSEKLENGGLKEDSAKFKLQSEIERTKVKILMLNEQLLQQKKRLSAVRSSAEKVDNSNQDHGLELLESYRRLNRHLNSLKEQETNIKEEKNTLKQIIEDVKQRRRHLLSQLPLVFPVLKTVDEIKYSICGVCLPDAERYGTYSDQSLSVALGYVAHLLVKVAFLINIPLKYPIILKGSQSSIADRTSSQLPETDMVFPLFSRGKEREKLHFNYAVFLLNKNIAQLRWNCGLPTPDLRSTLFNIWNFLCQLHEPSIADQRIFMPDTVVPPLVIPASLKTQLETPEVLLQHDSPNVSPKPDSRLHPSTSSDWLVTNAPLEPSEGKCVGSLSDLDYEIGIEDRHVVGSLSDQDYEVGIEERRILGSLSDQDYEIGTDLVNEIGTEVRCDGTASDSDVCNFRNENNHRNSSQDNSLVSDNKPLKLRPNSYSLDHGLNSIEFNESITKLQPNDCIDAGRNLSIPNLSSNSFLNAEDASKDFSTDQLSQPQDFCEKATDVLRSWHQDTPCPYQASNAFSSSEQLDQNDKFVLETKDTSKDLTNTNQINCPTSLESDPSLIIPLKTDQKELIEEMKKILPSFDFEEMSFLEDVASRTANLASHNCSFKLSFSKDSVPDK